MANLDGWILPTLPIPAPELNAIDTQEQAETLQKLTGRNLSFVNKLGFTAVTVPAGLTGEGLPVGLQLLAPAGQDARLLGMARAVENTLGPLGKPDVSAFVKP